MRVVLFSLNKIPVAFLYLLRVVYFGLLQDAFLRLGVIKHIFMHFKNLVHLILDLVGIRALGVL